jgi:hypothetical protein
VYAALPCPWRPVCPPRLVQPPQIGASPTALIKDDKTTETYASPLQSVVPRRP